ncbi:hypothetical protein M569_08349 [Genlisea aurea]|uniref:Uncharacterized protein n=1 Tax=Genlisea aurea TaxID=192259 RepID=S8CI96_9LAMI|nr:hypothetical protein M569_08349 [Genlisea aurea]
MRRAAEHRGGGGGGWGIESVTVMLCVVALLIFLPLGMDSTSPLHPPPATMLLIFPAFMAAVLFFLSCSS